MDLLNNTFIFEHIGIDDSGNVRYSLTGLKKDTFTYIIYPELSPEENILKNKRWLDWDNPISLTSECFKTMEIPYLEKREDTLVVSFLPSGKYIIEE